MKTQPFKKSLANIFRLWAADKYDTALEKVEELQQVWPGNARLHVLRAGLIQLQQRPTAALGDAKQALREAIELDESSPAAAIELGNFLDAVEDNPKAASKQYSKAIGQARRLLTEALIGQAKALLQLEKREELLRCLTELFRLTDDAYPAKRTKSATSFDIIVPGSNGHVAMLGMNGPYAAQIEQLVNEVLATENTMVAK